LISEILSIRHREYLTKTDKAWEWEDGIRQMVAGGLQVAASQLLEQRTQEQAGERELFDGLRVIERQRSENRAARKPPSKGRKKPKEDFDL
jgi:hypothetical protein